jgi:aryl-alcohol dehydrogenase-like predicted oxidoreductase
MLQKSQYRALGASGLMVSPLGVGTNRWSLGKNDEAVFESFQAFIDAGGNFFDTAEVYGGGKSESLLGASMQRDARPVVVASKFAPLPTRLTSRQFMKALDGSLQRLAVQTIDLYYIHWPFTFLSVEKLMDLMAQAVQAGKIRAVGVSNFNATQMRRAAARLSRYDIPLAANEVYYSLLHRQPETNGVLDACRELNVALIAYRPFDSGQTIAPLSAATKKPADVQSGLQEALSTIAQSHNVHSNQVILNWLLRRDEHVIPIPGARNARHLIDNVSALSWTLSDEEFSLIDQASAPQKA